MEELPKVEPSKYYLPPANSRSTGVASKKESYKTTRESSLQPISYTNDPDFQAFNEARNNVMPYETDRSKQPNGHYGSKSTRRTSEMVENNLPSPRNEFQEYDFNRQLPSISPRMKKLDAFLNSGFERKPVKAKKLNKKNLSANDYKLFFGTPKGSDPAESNFQCKVRIRGKLSSFLKLSNFCLLSMLKCLHTNPVLF